MPARHAPRPALPDATVKRAIIAACARLISDVQKPRFLPGIRPTDMELCRRYPRQLGRPGE